MDFALFSIDGILFVSRWLHFFFGVIWIGHLYYFNFVQGPFFNEIDAGTKSVAIQKLVPRALWWFRWGSFWTMFTGLVILGIEGHRAGFEIFQTSWGATILIGASLGLLMGSNVWFIIWPNQKIVIQSATQAASGGAALPTAAPAGARALVASRTNALFSIPMLFFMGAAKHLPIATSETSSYMGLTMTVAIILIAIELNAIKGKTGPLTTIKGVITCGFILSAILYAAVEVFL